MRKRLLFKTFALVAALLCAQDICAADYDFVQDGIYYEIMTDGTAYVWYEDVSSWDPCYFNSVYCIPDSVTYNGETYPVTGIGPYVFYNCSNLEEIVLPSTIKKVEYRAFQGCSSLKYIISRAANPPLTGGEVFDYSTYSTATLVVPSQSAVTSYSSATTWKNFANIITSAYDSFLNIEGGSIHFTSEGDYPWILKDDGERTWVQSGNAGVHSSTSTLTATVTVEHSTYLYFDYITQGERTTYNLNDICYFRVDGKEVFALTDYYSDWAWWTTTLTPGTHTLTWTYKKNASVNPPGDYFALDNVYLYCPYDDNLNAALNVEGGTIEFYSDGEYPWIAVAEGGRYYGMSGNQGVHSSQSEVWAKVKVDEPSILTFDFKAMGENYDGAPADVCIFMYNGSSKLYYGAHNSEWETFTMEVNPGVCEMRFIYGKDVSDNGEGDYFALDNVVIRPKVTRGDVDGDGSVGIADVTALIDYILTGNTTGVNLGAADCDQTGDIGIADVTALIDFILTGNW